MICYDHTVPVKSALMPSQMLLVDRYRWLKANAAVGAMVVILLTRDASEEIRFQQSKCRLNRLHNAGCFSKPGATRQWGHCCLRAVGVPRIVTL